MAESAPPPSNLRKRPWYLVAALVAASVIGLNSTLDGVRWIRYFHDPRPNAALELSREEGPGGSRARPLLEGAQRTAVVEATELVLDARDAKHQRFFALAVLELVLGAAIFFVAGRAMSGRLTARNMLLQLLLARAAASVVDLTIGGDVRRANVGLIKATVAAQAPPAGQEDAYRATEKVLGVLAEGIVLVPFGAMFGACALIVVALTRPRSRDFFDPGPDAAPER